MSLADHSATPRGRAFLWGGLLLGILLVVVLLTHGFGLLGREEEPASDATGITRKGDQIVVPEHSRLRERLKVAPARAETTRTSLTLPGVVESDPAHTFAVLSPVAGRVIKLEAALGDRVRAGQVLAIIDSPDLAQAYADYDKATDALALTGKNLQRQQGQVELGTASTRDLDQARSDNSQAAAELTRAQARLRVLHAPVDPQHRAAYLSVTAPASGSITTLSIAPGNMINDPTQTLLTVADLSTVWVTALVPEKDLGSVARNQDAQVVLSAYPHKVFGGKVLFVSDVIEPDSRRDKLRIAFENPDIALKPNMFATVTLLGDPQSRIVLPTSALLMNNDRTTVFVATAPWTFERRAVETQLREGPTVTVEKGLNAGEQVVVQGGILLND
jgi:cobalt-zinc-cadmium efflux system membrane fusion protein